MTKILFREDPTKGAVDRREHSKFYVEDIGYSRGEGWKLRTLKKVWVARAGGGLEREGFNLH